MKRDIRKLTVADYDFSTVKKEELNACWWYEYARESRGVIKVIAAEKKKRGNKMEGQINFGPLVRNDVLKMLLFAVSNAGDFPNAPWQTLTGDGKKLLIKIVFALDEFARHSLKISPLVLSTDDPGSTTLEVWKEDFQKDHPLLMQSGQIKFGFFAMNIAAPQPLLIKEFSGQLRIFHGKPKLEYPPAPKAAPKPTGRKTKRDELNALGALRLRFHCKTFAEAKKRLTPLQSKSNGMYYAQRNTMNRACDSALATFRNFFGWLDPENPIHFRPGWQGIH